MLYRFLDSFLDGALDHVSNAWGQTQESHDVGEKPRREEQRSGQQDDDAVEQGISRKSTLRHLGLYLAEHRQALPPRECRAQRTGEENNGDRGEQADQPAEFDEQDKLDGRDGDEEEEELAHGENIVRTVGWTVRRPSHYPLFMRISAAQSTWFRLLRSGLVDPYNSAPEAASKLVGIQGQIHTAAGLALWNRVSDMTLKRFESALYRRRSLVKLWGQRNTLHVYRTTDWPLFVGALQNRQTWLERALQRTGADDVPYHELLRVMGQQLVEGGTISRKDMREMRIAPDNEWLTWGGVIMRLVRDGTVCHAEGDSGETHFVHRMHWVPKLDWNPPAAEVAQRELVLRYVRAYGPVTVQDLAFWLGVPVPDARMWLDRIESDLVDVDVDGKPMVALRKDRKALLVPAPPSGKWPVCLLYRFDPLLLGLKKKDWIVPAEHYKKVWRAGGHIEGSILVCDRVRGTWRYDRGVRGITVSLYPFDPLPRSVLRTLRSRASGIARFFGVPLARLDVTNTGSHD